MSVACFNDGFGSFKKYIKTTNLTVGLVNLKEPLRFLELSSPDLSA